MFRLHACLPLLLAPAFAGSHGPRGHLKPGGDRDGDGLVNGYERSIGTNPYRADSDHDGWSDWTEVVHGGGPISRRDSADDDGWDDWTEVVYGGDCAAAAVTP